MDSTSNTSKNLSALTDRMNNALVVSLPTWKYFNNTEWITLDSDDQTELEKEYQKHLSGTQTGSKTFHCFGNGYSAIINYDLMVTECGSGKCMLKHNNRALSGFPSDHMTYKLKRTTD
jgi:hypothetical protein